MADREILFSYIDSVWITYGDFDSQPCGIDFEIATDLAPFRYETLCFRELRSRVARYPDGRFCIGPHLIDYLLWQSSFRYLVRPDAFIMTDCGKTWLLTDICEFKYCRSLDLTQKLRGFSQLLSSLRDSRSELLQAMSAVMGSMITIPGEIVIPKDREINVTFMAPLAGGASDTNPTEFRLSYWRLPLKPDTD